MANRFLSGPRQSDVLVILKGGLIFSILVMIGFYINSVNFEDIFKRLAFTNGAASNWYFGPTGFVLLGAFLMCISCPRQIVSFFAAYFFGFVYGVLFSWLAVVLACLATVLMARVFKRQIADWITGKIAIAVHFWEENTFMVTVLLRFLPAGSNWLTNLTAGALGIPVLRFVAGSAVGYLPQTIIFAMVGSGTRIESTAQITMSLCLFVISTALGLRLYLKFRENLTANS